MSAVKSHVAFLGWLMGGLLVGALLVRPAYAQDKPASPPTMEELLKKIQALENRVHELEDEKQAAKPVAPKDKLDPAPAAAEKPRVDSPLVNSLTIGAKLRLRYEMRDPGDYRRPGTFGRPATDEISDSSDFIDERTRVYFDAQVVEKLRAYIEFQDSRRFGEETSFVADTADIDLRQGFVEYQKILDQPLMMRAGRMEVPALGDQRLFSPLDWSNVSRSWDGVYSTYTPDDFWFGGFAVNFREAQTFGISPDADNDSILGGLYASYRGVKDHEFDLYGYFRNQSDDVFTSEKGGPLGDRHDWTMGARIKGGFGGFGYTAEGVYQIGDQVDDDVRAWAVAGTAHYTFDMDWKPKILGEYTFASGDDNPTDGVVGTFDPLLTFGHFYHGHMDLVGWRNIHSGKLALQVNPGEKWSVHLDGHSFWLDQNRDSWYNAAGAAVRRDTTGNAGSHVGSEIDLYTKFNVWKRVDFWIGYSHFFAGEYVNDTGEDFDQDWGFISSEVKF